MLQIGNATLGNQGSLDGSLELNDLFSHLERVANSMLAKIERDAAIFGKSLPDEFRSLGDALVFGGFSRQSGLVLRSLRFDRRTGKWKLSKVRNRQSVGLNKRFHIFGDRESKSRYSYLLKRRLEDRDKLRTDRPFDFEPLEVLWDFLRLPASDSRPLPLGRRPPTVGGALQAVRMVPGAQALPLVVQWGLKGEKFLLGRRLLDYENVDLPLLEETACSPRLLLRARNQW